MTFVALAALAASLPGTSRADAKGNVKRGEYLVTIGGCNDCHTPLKMTPNGPAPDMDRMLSGHPEGQADPSGTLGKGDLAISGVDFTALTLAFGTVYTRNLTPDKTGLGDWTEEQFIKTIRLGRHQGDGRALLPPMPWYNYANLTDEDIKAVWAYLRSIKPIKNTVPDPKVPPQVLDQMAKANQMMSDGIKAHLGRK
jgi:mono/diheme cytochrome c family protein